MTSLTDRLQHLLGTPVRSASRLSGGDISEVYSVQLGDGRSLVAKRGGPSGTEARMLAAIAATGCPAPDIVAHNADLLVMTHMAEGRGGTGAGWADAGQAIARLHATTGDTYGWPEDTAFGSAPCPATPTDDWPSFWAERRLLAWPEALPAQIAVRVETLASRLPEWLPKRPRPSLLHGDLWSGNVLFDGAFSGLIDPACYRGDAEVDLAMLTLFGTPRSEFWHAYGALEPGWDARRSLYQLWPALVHLRLFGAGYRGMVEARLAACGV